MRFLRPRSVLRFSSRLPRRVIATARRADRLADLANGTGAEPLVLDVRDKAAVAEAAACCQPYVLVQQRCPGDWPGTLAAAYMADWESLVHTNFTWPDVRTRAVLPRHVRARGRFHGSTSPHKRARYPYPGVNGYGGLD